MSSTDGCTSGACNAMRAAPDSLTQGASFAKMTSAYHGGRRHRRATRRSRRSHRRRTHRRRQHGGMVNYPDQFSVELPSNMRAAADVAKLDTAFAQLPQFAGKYGMTGGSRRRQRGGAGFAYTPAPVTANPMIISPAEEPKAFLNPQWYTENTVVPSFKGPENALAQQSYNNQFVYAQRAGTRRRRRASSRKNSRRANRRRTHRRN